MSGKISICDNSLVVEEFILKKKVKKSALKVTNDDVEVLARELEALAQENRSNESDEMTDEESILTSIVGSWRIVSTIGLEEYMKKWGTRKEFDAIFQVGTQNFEVEGDVVTMSNTIGITEHWKGKYVLGVKKNGAIVTVDGNMLVSIYFAEESREEYMRLERFVKNGQLHIVTKRFGLTCTRIYEKIGAKDLDSSERIAELEAELEKLKEERITDKKASEQLVRKCFDVINGLTNEVKELKSTRAAEEERVKTELRFSVDTIMLLNHKNLELTDEVERLTAEKDTKKKNFEDEQAKLLEELDNEKEEKEKLNEQYLESTLKVQELETKVGELELERAVIEKELEVKNEEIKQLKKEDQIETNIIGSWRPVHCSSLPDHLTTFSIENGNLIETSPRNHTTVWAMNIVNHEYTEHHFAHTSVKNNQIISIITLKNNGKKTFSFERSVEGDLLKVVIKDCQDKEIMTSEYARVV